MTHTAEDVARSRMRFHVTHELSEQELEDSFAQRCFDLRPAHPVTISLTAPAELSAELHTALAPLGRIVSDELIQTNLHIVALPWGGGELFDSAAMDVEEIPLLPIRFDQFSVTVGPLMDGEGPCPTCALPAILTGATQPNDLTKASLFAAAASSCAWYVQAFDAHASSATALSTRIDSRTPRIEHRMWTCLPGCRREKAA